MSDYIDMNRQQQLPQANNNGRMLTDVEVAQIRQILNASHLVTAANNGQIAAARAGVPPAFSMDSDYEAFSETTHAWAVFADDPNKPATKIDRTVGTLIILFQLFTYSIFGWEAIEDYQEGKVPIFTDKNDCIASDEAPNDNFICEVEYTNFLDAIIAFSMLGIFLSGDFIQAIRAIRKAPQFNALIFACLAGIEVIVAYFSATLAISYQLYIGEVTDAIEVGVGLLFIRELSSKAYHGIRQHSKKKEYKSFGSVLCVLIGAGLVMEQLYERLLAA